VGCMLFFCVFCSLLFIGNVLSVCVNHRQSRKSKKGLHTPA
jgi:hypothetical protein